MKDESYLNNLPALISAFGVCILSLSIAYDFGYFIAFGVTFAEMPTTLTDHLRSSLVWIPTALIGIFIFLVSEMFLKRMEKGLTEEEIIQGSKNPEQTARFRRSPKYVLIASACLVPIIHFLFVKLPASS